MIAYADDIKADHLGVGRPAFRHAPGSRQHRGSPGDDGGLQARFQASVGVGITGVAGPDESEHKPVGLVFVAVASPGGTRVLRLDEDRGREANRAYAVRAALTLCLEVAREIAKPQDVQPPDR